MKAIEIKALDNHKLFVLFDDRVSGEIDLKKLVSKGIFRVLKDQILFAKAYSTRYSIAFSDELEIDILSVYAELSGKKPEEVLRSSTLYASN